MITCRASRAGRERFRPTHEEIVAFLSEVGLFSSLKEKARAELESHFHTMPMADRALGRSFIDRSHDPVTETRFFRWVNRVEDDTGIVLLQGEFGDDTWNQRCIHQADRVYLLADPGERPDLTRL